MTAFETGVLAGLALVVPLGAIGVLLIQEGASRGWVDALPAASAVATVDVLYCVAAVGVGAALAPVIMTWDPWPRIIGGTILLGLAARNLVRAGRSAAEANPGADPDRNRLSRRYILFFGLTAINPATLVYFAAITAGLSTIASTPAAAALFVGGVALASLSWQLLLVLVGAILRWRTGTRARQLTTVIGNGAVGLLGIIMIAGFVS